MRINTYRGIFTNIWHAKIINNKKEAYEALSMAIHIRGQGSHLGNETKTSVPALIPRESSDLCENTRTCLDPNFKITVRLLLL